MRSSLARVLVPVLLLAAPCTARADNPGPVVEGERVSAVFPDTSASPLRVVGGTLVFTLSPGLAAAEVRAVYRLANPGRPADPNPGRSNLNPGRSADPNPGRSDPNPGRSDLNPGRSEPNPGEPFDVAFAVVRGEHEEDLAARIVLEVDGAPAEARTVRAADRLAPLLVAWLEAHPEVSRLLSEPAPGAAPADLLRRVEAAGGHCDEECTGLVAWHKSSLAEEDDRLSKDLADDVLVSAAREAIPAAVDALERAVGVTGGGGAAERIDYLVLPVPIPPGQTRTVTARYWQHGSIDRAAQANAIYGFDIPFAPARRWAGFGPLDVSVRLPAPARFSSRVSFVRDGDGYRADLPGLPEGDLRFEAMPLAGLWFGMVGRTGYWALLMAAMAVAAVLVGFAAGRAWAVGVRVRRVMVPLLAGGPIAAVCNFALFVVLFGAFPEGALGFGTAGLVRGLWLVALSVPVGAAASAVLGARGRGAVGANRVAEHGR